MAENDVKDPELKEEEEIAEDVILDDDTSDEILEETSDEASEEDEEQVSDEEIEILKAKVSGQKQRIENLEKMLADKQEDQEKLERLTNEFNNFKTRTLNDRKLAKVNGKIKTVNEVLDVIDNLDRAMKFKSDSEEFKAGLVMINNNLKAKLSDLGVNLEENNDK